MSTKKSTFTSDTSFADRQVSQFTPDAGKRNPMTRVPKQNPRTSDQNVNAAPNPASTSKPTFGPQGPGAAFKKSGFDRETGDTRTGQDS